MTPSTIVVTASMIEPIVEAVTDNVGVVFPYAIGIMGIFIGIKSIPRIIHMFF